MASSGNKRIAKNTGMLYIRQLFVMGIAFFTSRLTLQVLGEKDFGIYAATGGITILLTTLTNSMSGCIQRFMTFAIGKNDRTFLSKVYSSAFAIQLLVSFLLFLLIQSVGVWLIYNKLTIPADRLDIAFWAFQISMLISILGIINVTNHSMVIAHEDMRVFALVSIGDAIVRLCMVCVLFLIEWDKLLFYAIGLLIAQSLYFTIYFVYCRKRYSEARISLPDKKIAKEMLGFASWNTLYSASTMGFMQGVNFLLNIFFGPALNAAYSVAMQAYHGIRNFCSGFQLASSPQIVKLYSMDEIEQMHKLVIATCKISFFLIYFISLPFLLNSDYILSLWLVDVPEHTRNFFCLLLIYAYFDVFAYPVDIAVQATGKIARYNIFISINILAVLPISYVLLLNGEAAEVIYIVALLLSLTGMFIRLCFLAKLIHVSRWRFFVQVYARAFIVALASAICPIILTCYLDKGVGTTILSFVSCFISVGIFVYVLGLKAEERLMVNKILSKIKQKLPLGSN